MNVVQETAPQCKGLLLDPPPRAFLTSGMGDASMEFSLVIHVGESADREKIKHELGKRILRRYQSGEIQLPSGG